MDIVTNPYGLAMTMRRSLYRSGMLKAVKVSVPVISIGNLTVGGTGKTPITKLVAQFLRDSLHRRVAIVMRGYRRETKGFLIVSDGVTTFADALASGDEAQLYAEELANVIVICDEDRVRGAQKAIELGADIIVLDDGYQHLAIYRDLNILLVAAQEPQGAIIPLGRFRESIAASQDADIILITGAVDDDFSVAEHVVASYPLNPGVLVSQAIQRPVVLTDADSKQVELSILAGRKILAVSAIAKPERFHTSLKNLGAEVVPFVLPDHNRFDEQICAEIVSMASKNECAMIVQTSKDAVKSGPFLRASSIPAYTLHVAYTVTGEARFFDRIRSVLQTKY